MIALITLMSYIRLNVSTVLIKHANFCVAQIFLLPTSSIRSCVMDDLLAIIFSTTKRTRQIAKHFVTTLILVAMINGRVPMGMTNSIVQIDLLSSIARLTSIIVLDPMPANSAVCLKSWQETVLLIV
jgi:hypothetical protein